MSVQKAVLSIVQTFEAGLNELEQTNSQLQGRVAELEERLNQNSKNSSRPPSQAGVNRRDKGRGMKPASGSGRLPKVSENKPPPLSLLYPIEACKEVHEQIPRACRECVVSLKGRDP